MSQLPPIQSFHHPRTGREIQYNCVIGVQGRATLCLIHDKGIQWGDVWLDELPETVSQELLRINFIQDFQQQPASSNWLITSVIWLAGIAVLMGLLYL